MHPSRARPEKVITSCNQMSKSESLPISQLGDTMQKNTKRVAMAAGLSLSGFLCTFAWYHLSARDLSSGDKSRPIARMVVTFNEVQRKPVTKLIWQPVGENEILHIGEAIRTAANSEATIEFLNGSTKIVLDPDSAIVLEENAGKVALNFLQGNMFVKAEGNSADTNVTLNSGGKQIALGQSELSLGKSANGQLDLQVLKGQAKIESNGKTQTVEQGKSLTAATFKLLAPSGDSPIFTDKSKNEKVPFEWAPLDPSYTVVLEAGPTRASMKAFESTETSGAGGKLEAALKYGRTFYRLVARSSDPAKPLLTTLVFKNEVVAIVPPTLLEPEKGKPIVLSADAPQVKFAWSNPSQFEKVKFELSKSPDMKPTTYMKMLDDVQNLSLDFKNQGRFYWRVSGQIKGRKELVASDIQAFDVKLFKGLQSPTLDLPIASDKISAPSVGLSVVAFSWQPVPAASQYKVILESATLKNGRSETSSEISQTRVRDLKPGLYTWSVVALDDKGQTSQPSEKRNFEIANLPALEWGKVNDMTEQEYVSLKPTLELDWKPTQLPFSKYMVKVSDTTTGESVSVEVAVEKAVVEIPADGEYFAEVEALSKTGETLARTTRKRLQVKAAALLPAPTFAQNTPPEIMASGSGNAKVAWSPVQGATKYMVILKSKSGQEPARELAFDKGAGDLSNLMPGEYSVTLKSVDRYGRSGPEGETRPLKVPATSAVKAPKFKGYKVK